jgi:pSer/pThr/pTyr-binding forkhead associated (FHA) protein
MPTLIVNRTGGEEPAIHRIGDETITIGRLDTNALALASRGVSRSHAKIVADGENFFLIDMKSGNGTFLNGLQLRPEERNLLQAGDIISIDEFDIKFQPEDLPLDEVKNEEVTGSDILEVKLLKKVLGALDKDTLPSVEVLNGTAEGKKFFFSEGINEIVIGRDPECDFPINEYVVSRRHANISRRWGGIAIRDLESKNGTFLNNRRVVEEYLHDGDRIALGTIVMIFRNPQEINLADIDGIRPKNPPPQIKAEDVPVPAAEKPVKVPEIEEQAEGAAHELEESSAAIEDWERLEQEAAMENYPAPEPKIEKIKTLTPLEIGMIGLGGLVLIFAIITVINLMAS